MAIGSERAFGLRGTAARRQRRWTVAVLGLLVMVTAAMSYRLDTPWIGVHAWASSAFSTMARNHREYGFGVTKLASVQWINRRDPVESPAYGHHPMGYPLVLAGAFQVFGAAESTARLVAISFSLGSVVALYGLISRLFGAPAGFFGAAFFGLSPLNLYYGRVVSLEQPVVFFLIVAVYLYVRWIEADASPRFWLFLAAMVGGMLIEWPAYYLGAVLPLHYLLFVRRPEQRPHVALMFISGPLIFALFLVHLSVTDAEQVRDVWQAFVTRTGLMAAEEQVRLAGHATVYGPWQLLWRLGYNAQALMSEPVLVLAGASVVWLSARAVGNADRRMATSIVLLLLVPGLAHTILFSNTMYIHNYLIIFYLPGIAALAGVAAAELLAGWRLQELRGLVMAALLVTFLLRSFAATAEQHADTSYREAVRLGRTVAAVSEPLDQVLVVGMVQNPVVEWYADRDVYFLRAGSVETPPRARAHGASKVVLLKRARQFLREPRSMDGATDVELVLLDGRTQALSEWLEREGAVIAETEESIVYVPPSTLSSDPRVGPAFWEPARRRLR